MAVVFRFVDKDGILQERFFDLIHVTSTKGATLKEVLSSLLSKHAFDVQNLRGQGYDGASKIRGVSSMDCKLFFLENAHMHIMSISMLIVCNLR
jgi:hypothetical protein